ncbi:hypothetical protein C8R45DRAFT_1111790 [Mycena sanguinolenta]|nr:hypothetical protein C8R45DRAFT_1111790 [Mycena sanguinolenta]
MNQLHILPHQSSSPFSADSTRLASSPRVEATESKPQGRLNRGVARRRRHPALSPSSSRLPCARSRAVSMGSDLHADSGAQSVCPPYRSVLPPPYTASPSASSVLAGVVAGSSLPLPQHLRIQHLRHPWSSLELAFVQLKERTLVNVRRALPFSLPPLAPVPRRPTTHFAHGSHPSATVDPSLLWRRLRLQPLTPLLHLKSVPDAPRPSLRIFNSIRSAIAADPTVLECEVIFDSSHSAAHATPLGSSTVGRGGASVKGARVKGTTGAPDYRFSLKTK